ncbi:MAG: hypothetical protein U9R15_00530 [Chloroflexota bacterium]|nr:hypothetical protein [Chloroflexota bacterium]
MAKHSKMQKVVVGTLAAMMVASLVLAVAAFALPTLARAASELGSRGSWYEYRNCGSCIFDYVCGPYPDDAQLCEYWWCVDTGGGPYCTFQHFVLRCCY